MSAAGISSELAVRRPVTVSASVGAAIVAGIALWHTFGAGGADDAKQAHILLIGGCLVTFVVGALAERIRGWLMPAAVVLGAVVVIVMAGDSVISTRPLEGPFGYANARAAFFIQAATAALMLVASVRQAAIRVVGTIAAVGFITIPIVSGSSTSVFIAVLMVGAVAAGVATAWRNGRGLATIAIVLAAAALSATVIAGATYVPGEPSAMHRVAISALSERRLLLWGDAIEIIRERPLTGVGIGAFDDHSATALEDEDARWAHNGFLQHGAEAGLPGLALILGLFAWAFWNLRSRSYQPVTVIAAFGLAALVIHSSIDYILHFAAIPLVAAALIGSATSKEKRD